MPTVLFDATDASTRPLRGWGRYVAELARALHDARPADLEVRPVAGGRRLPEAVWEQWSLPRRARREGAQVIHAPNCFLPLRRPCAGVVTVHDLAFETHPEDFSARTGAKYRLVVPRAVRSAERVICVSHATARDVIERYGVSEGRVRVIGLAPALPGGPGEREPVSGDAPPYLLGVGDLRQKKDFATLVRAWLGLRAEGRPLGLVIAGADGGEAGALRALAAGQPLELPGYVPDARLDALLRGAVALVHPSRHEGFGLVMLEAMIRGTPVLAAHATALPETAGDAAEYFAPGDHQELERRLRTLLDDPRRRRLLADRGRERAARMTWSQTAAATLDVYRELL